MTMPVNTRPSGAITISGNAQAGQLLTVWSTLVDLDDMPGVHESGAIQYQWRANGAALAGATGPTYRLTDADAGSRITVTAQYTDLGGTVETLTSAASLPIAAAAAAFTALPRVRLKTTLGDLVVELEADRAPITVANFLAYANENFYDDTEFHRIISTFMAQGGGYDLDNGQLVQRTARHSAISLEKTSATGLSNLAGTLAMARSSVANSATSEFFINFVDNLFLDAAYTTDGNGYAVFGHVVGGADVLAKLKAVPVVDNGSGKEVSLPTEAVTLIDVMPEPPASGAPPIGSVTISGTVRQGQTLVAQAPLTDRDGIPTSGAGAIRYYWSSDDGLDERVISGATGSSLVLSPALVGKTIRAHAEYTDLLGTTGAVASAATLPVANVNDLPAGRILISGTPVAGATLSASHSLRDADGIPAAGVAGEPQWQWYVSGNPIDGATASTFTVPSTYESGSITVTVSYTDLGGSAESVLSAAAGSDPAPTAPSLPRVFMRTNHGDILIELESAKAPITTTNFLKYVDHGFYDSTVIHRVNTAWGVVQGGGYTLTQGSTSGEYSYTEKAVPNWAPDPIALERTASTGLGNQAGTIAMARDTAPDTATRQFFFNLTDNGPYFDSTGSSDNGNGYAVFGRILDGFTTLESIKTVSTQEIPPLKEAPFPKAVLVHFAYSDLHPPSGQVLITGSPAQGQTLVASHTLVDSDNGITAVSYQWRAAGLPIVGATSDSLFLTQSLVGKAISVEALYLDRAINKQYGYIASTTTAPVADIDDLPIGQVRIEGRAELGRILTALHSLGDLDNGVSTAAVTTVGWQWYSGSTPIAGATTATLALGPTLAGHSISVRASYTDAANHSHQVSSLATEPVRMAAVTGSVYHWRSHALIEGVQIDTPEAGSTAPAQAATSGIDGRWTIDGLDFDALVPVSANLDAGSGELARAVTAADALAALKLAVGRGPNGSASGSAANALPASPYQLISADVDRDGEVTLDDARSILQRATTGAGATVADWRFIPETETLWTAGIGSVYHRGSVATDDAVVPARAGQPDPVNLVGVLVGDVDGSWTPGESEPAPASSYDRLSVDYFNSLVLAPDALAQWGIGPV